MAVDERTPVIIGVGQFTERIDDPDYRGMSAVELATAACSPGRVALEPGGTPSSDEWPPSAEFLPRERCGPV